MRQLSMIFIGDGSRVKVTFLTQPKKTFTLLMDTYKNDDDENGNENGNENENENGNKDEYRTCSTLGEF